ncbi:MAG: nucleotidyltransferase domain-containing protein [Candidatus Marinimicrobia bacterium]|nr:nucleotidyltransferase domain-containing protein [Candidatus Neomarinimicrobiota bacterium]
MTIINLNHLKRLFDGCNDIAAAMIFGSAQSGVVRVGGDLDVAVLYSQIPSPDRLFELMAEITETIGFDNVDLINLNRAGTVLAFEALNGTVISRNDREKLATFSSLVAREYEDEMALLTSATKSPIMCYL